MTLALLALALASYVWFLKGAALRRRWRGPGASRSRVERLRCWMARAWLLFGTVSAAALALLGQFDTLRRLPDAFVPLARAVRTALVGQGDPADTGLLAAAVAGGLAGGAGVGLLIAAWRRRRGRGDLHIGRIAGLLPRSRTELRWGAAVAVTAGVVEELFFRLLLPLLVTQASGSALAGFGIATLLFGLAHGYQRLAGMIATTLAGGLFAALYLYSGALWLAMLAHVLLDLNSLFLRPAFAGAWRERH